MLACAFPPAADGPPADERIICVAARGRRVAYLTERSFCVMTVGPQLTPVARGASAARWLPQTATSLGTQTGGVRRFR